MFRFCAAVAASAAILATATAPAFAQETFTMSSMIVADVGHDVAGFSGGTNADAKIVHAGPVDLPGFEKLAHIGGSAVVRVTLNAKGVLVNSSILNSSGHSRLDECALTAVRASTFAPARFDGQPTGGQYAVDVTFDGSN